MRRLGAWVRVNGLLLFSLFAACGLVVLLGAQNKRLLSEQEAIYTRSLKPAPGSWVPVLEQRAINGQQVQVGAAERSQIIYFFDTACPFCKASADSIRRIQGQLDQNRNSGIQMVGVGSGSGMASYLSQNGFTFPTIPQSKKLTHLFGVKQVPLLIATDPDGKVIYSHVGELGIKEEKAILTAVLRSKEGQATAQ